MPNRALSIDNLLDWLSIRDKQGIKMPTDLSQLICDIDHSLLLSRIGDKKKIFEYPPPVIYSSPWYEVLENDFLEFEGWDINLYPEDRISKDFADVDGGQVVYLGQHLWQVIEFKTPDEVYIKYDSKSPYIFLLQKLDKIREQTGNSYFRISRIRQ